MKQIQVFPEKAPDVSTVCAALADTSRAAMCAALMSGKAWTVGELARYAGLTRSTATTHVNHLVTSGIVRDIRQGRHRYVAIAGQRVADAIEGLGVISSDTFQTPKSLNSQRLNSAVTRARTCYSHFAGTLGVKLCDQLTERNFISPEWHVTKSGQTLFASWGIADATSFSCQPCLDCTERRFHIAGQLGRQICRQFFKNGWVERVEGSRAVRITDSGDVVLREIGVLL